MPGEDLKRPRRKQQSFSLSFLQDGNCKKEIHKMTFNRTKIRVAYTTVALSLLGGLATQPAMARNHPLKPDYKVLSRVALPNAKTTDLFLRTDQQGHTFLYVAFANESIAIFDVTDSREPHLVNRLALASNRSSFTLKPVNDRLAVATTANDRNADFTLLDLGSAPSIEIVKTLKNVDAYTIDNDMNTAYVAQDEHLLVLRFDQPVTRDAAVWEQFFEAR
jgi:hypothetical protein